VRALIGFILLAACLPAGAQSDFTPEEIAAIVRHGPWPPRWRPDPSNRVSGKPEAIAFGRRLFFEPRLSGPGSVLCATCHAPGKAFQDGKPLAFGLAQAARNTPTLVDVRYSHWFGWDGGHDSLWSQSIRPLLDPKEMASSPEHVADTVRKLFAADYEKTFRQPPEDDETVFVNVGKALAAFQETMVSGRTPFDAFRDALEKKDLQNAKSYPAAAQRGLRLFVGKGGCASCHAGPAFTSGEFASGVSAFTASAGKDGGRADGIRKLRADPLNLLGKYNDDPSRSTAAGTRRAEPRSSDFGEFRVPSLRGVAATAPYMHDGSLATLPEAVRHAAGGLKLTPSEAADLVAFLETLSAPR
jgi:cytochrome c peroxidase